MAKEESNTSTETDEGMIVFNGLMAEVDAALPRNLSGQIERQFHGAGAHAVNRRVALAILAMPFKEMEGKIRDDRDAAIAFADTVWRVNDSAQTHRDVAELMEKAALRTQLALCGREDMQEILSLVEAEKAENNGVAY